MGRAVAYFCNGLGNFVMGMPAYQAVASLAEDGRIDIVTNGSWKDSRRPAVEEICRKWPIVDRFISYPTEKFDPRNYSHWFFSPHGSNCDVVAIFQQRFPGTPVARPSWRASLMHEAEHYMQVAYALGYSGPWPDVVFPKADEPILDGPRPWIALCNGAFNTPYWRKKHWPHFGRLAQVLRQWFGGTIIGIGSEGELSGVPLSRDFTGKLSITRTAKVISQLDLLITTDTGNMHIAAVMDIPQIALFGSTLVSKNGPRSDRASVLQSAMDCAPCMDTGKFYHCSTAACMETITVGDVMALTRRKLEASYGKELAAAVQPVGEMQGLGCQGRR